MIGHRKAFKNGTHFPFQGQSKASLSRHQKSTPVAGWECACLGNFGLPPKWPLRLFKRRKTKEQLKHIFFSFSAAKESQMHSTVFRIQTGRSLQALGSSPESSVREISSQWRCAGHRCREKTVLICTVLGERVLHQLEKAHWLCEAELPGISSGLRLTNLQHHPGSDGDGGGWWWCGIGDLMVVIMVRTMMVQAMMVLW